MRKIVTEYRVPYADTDQMGVVYYGNYMALFERARNELMRACGYTYKECEAEGFMLPVVHAEADYKGEVPGATAVNCGNYRLHDLAMAKWEAAEFLKRKWKFTYPPAKRIKANGRTFFDA